MPPKVDINVVLEGAIGVDMLGEGNEEVNVQDIPKTDEDAPVDDLRREEIDELKRLEDEIVATITKKSIQDTSMMALLVYMRLSP